MRNFLLILLIGALEIQMLIACSTRGEDETKSSSSVVKSSSSTKTPSSSSSLDCSTVSSSSISEDLCMDFDPDTEVEHFGRMKKQFCDKRNGKKYAYVEIGEQTWMAENLNYDVCGSKCSDGNRFVDYNTENCDKYGRLYDWPTAITICPDGWHLPSDDEWTALMDYVGGDSVAGEKLKTTSGWKLDPWIYTCRSNENDRSRDDYIYCGTNGTDDYGFSALPGGYGFTITERFEGVGIGRWWSTTESSDRFAYNLCISNDFNGVYRYGHVKINFLSVRCVKDSELVEDDL